MSFAIVDRPDTRASCCSSQVLRLSTSGLVRLCRCAQPLVRRAAADLGLDRVQLADAFERLGRDRRVAALGDVVEAATEVAPAEGQRQRSAGALGIGQRIIGDVAVDLQDAAEAGEMANRVLAAATRRIEIGHGRRVGAAPWPIIARDGPQVAGLGAAAPRIEHGSVSSANSLGELFRISTSRACRARARRRRSRPSAPASLD